MTTLVAGASCTFTVIWDDADRSLCALFPNAFVEDIGEIFVTDAASEDDSHTYRVEGDCSPFS